MNANNFCCVLLNHLFLIYFCKLFMRTYNLWMIPYYIQKCLENTFFMIILQILTWMRNLWLVTNIKVMWFIWKQHNIEVFQEEIRSCIDSINEPTFGILYCRLTLQMKILKNKINKPLAVIVIKIVSSIISKVNQERILCYYLLQQKKIFLGK